MADWLAHELAAWRERTAFDHDDDLVFAHPQLGRSLDPSKVTKRFKAAVPRGRSARDPIPRPATHVRDSIAAFGAPQRAIQEFLGHADLKTTQIYAHYAPAASEVDMVDAAFHRRVSG